MYVDYVEKADIEINGEIVNTTVRRVRSVDLYNLAAEINRARAKNLKALVVVKADKGASFGAMQDIMKQMQENHLERFLILTDKETTKS